MAKDKTVKTRKKPKGMPCCGCTRNRNSDIFSEDPMLSDQQQYRYMTVDDMKSMGDDSMRVNVTDDENDNRHSGGVIVTDTMTKENFQRSNVANHKPDNVDIHRHPIHVGIPQWRNFLVSFLVDARGGAMRGCRHSGVRVIVPPRKAAMPMRITCRYLKRDKLTNPPPLMEGEALASRILELGPVGAKFLGPVIIEVPHFASLRGKEREIVILRSDNGETWREHTLEASEEAVQDVLNESFEGEELSQLEDLQTSRIVRILTVDFPHYFAVVSRIRQEVHAVGPEGGTVSSSAVPQVQAVFPPAALTKKIRVGLQAHPIPADLVAKLLGNRVAVSPIVTVEPRRRKFHKPITLTIPVPQAANKGMINQYSGDAPTLRLLCSITGGQSRAVWEDVTGSTPLTFVKDCVSFTTTVSARFWLMDCRNITEATRMATELYTHATHVPFMAKFVVFAKRVDPLEARLRVFCMTDDKEDKTLEHQEHFTEVAKSRDVEVLEGKTQYMEFAGNLVPVMKSGEQLQLPFRAFKENRVPFTARIKDPDAADMVGRIMFMSEPKVAKGEPPQTPICTLNILLPEKISPETGHSELDLLELSKNYSFLRDGGISRPDTIHRATIRLTDIANLLDRDWEKLAEELNVLPVDVDMIKSEHPGKPALQAAAMFKLWQSKGNKATGNTLEKALNKIGREDIVKKCIFNVELVTDDVEKAVARVRLDQPGFDSLKEELGPSRDSSLRRDGTLAEQKHTGAYDEPDRMKDSESVEDLSNVINSSHKQTKQHVTITNGTVFNGTSTPIKDKYASEEKDLGDDMAEFLAQKCRVSDTMTKKSRDQKDDDNKNRQVIEDANKLVSGVIQDAEKEKILAMEGLSGVYRDASKEAEGAVGSRDQNLEQSIEGMIVKKVSKIGEDSVEPLIVKERRLIGAPYGGKTISKTVITTTRDEPDSALITTKTTTVRESITSRESGFFGPDDPIIGSIDPTKDQSSVLINKTIVTTGPIVEEKIITTRKMGDKPEVQTAAFGANVPVDRTTDPAKGIARVVTDSATMRADDRISSEKEKLSKEDKEVADRVSKTGEDLKKLEGDMKKSPYEDVYNVQPSDVKDEGKKKEKGGIFSGIFKGPKQKKSKPKDSVDSGDEEIRITTKEFLDDTRKIADEAENMDPFIPDIDSPPYICICPAKLPENEPRRDLILATEDFLLDTRRIAEEFTPTTPEEKPIVQPAADKTVEKKSESRAASEDPEEHKEKHGFFSNFFKGSKKTEDDVPPAVQKTKDIKETIDDNVSKSVRIETKRVQEIVDPNIKKLEESVKKEKDGIESEILHQADSMKKSMDGKIKAVEGEVHEEIKALDHKIKQSPEKIKKTTETAVEETKQTVADVKKEVQDTTDEIKEKSGGFFGIFKSPKSKDKKRSKHLDKSKDISVDSSDEESRIVTAAFLDDTRKISDIMMDSVKHDVTPEKGEALQKFRSSVIEDFDMPSEDSRRSSYDVKEIPTIAITTVSTVTTVKKTIASSSPSSPEPRDKTNGRVNDDEAIEKIQKLEKRTSGEIEDLSDDGKSKGSKLFGMFKSPKLKNKKKSRSRDRSVSQEPSIDSGDEELRLATSKFLADTQKTADKLGEFESPRRQSLKDSVKTNMTVTSVEGSVKDISDGKAKDEDKEGIFGILKNPLHHIRSRSKSREKSSSTEVSFDSGDEELRQTTSKFLEDTRHTAAILEEHPYPSAPGHLLQEKEIKIKDEKPEKPKEKRGFLSGIFKDSKHSADEITEDVKSTMDTVEASAKVHTEKVVKDGKEKKEISQTLEQKAPKDTVEEKTTKIISTYPAYNPDSQVIVNLLKSSEVLPHPDPVLATADFLYDSRRSAEAFIPDIAEEAHTTAAKTEKIIKDTVVDGKNKIEELVDISKDLAEKEAKLMKEKVSDVSEVVADTAEMTKDKVEKDVKKNKEKGKGFFSGIFKGVKHAADEVSDDVKSFVDETKKEAEEEEARARKATKDAVKAEQDILTKKIEEDVQKISNGAKEAKEKIHQKIDQEKEAIKAGEQVIVAADKDTVEKISDATAKTVVKVKEDVKVQKEKAAKAVDSVIDTAEGVKDNADKEIKKSKEKGKGFFSGIFKGVKHTADEAREDVREFVDETKKEAQEEEERAKLVANETAKKAKEKIANVTDSMADTAGKVKDQVLTQEQRITEITSDAAKKASEDAAKAKDAVEKEIATNTKAARDIATDAAASLTENITDVKKQAETEAQALKEELHDADVKLAEESAKIGKEVDDKLEKITKGVEKAVTEGKKDVDTLKVKLDDEAKTVSHSVDATKQTMEKEAKKVKDKSKGFFSGIFKGSKHSVDEATTDAKAFLDDAKREASLEKAQMEQDAKDTVKKAKETTEEVKDKVQKELVAGKDAIIDAGSATSKQVHKTAEMIGESVEDAKNKAHARLIAGKDATVDATKAVGATISAVVTTTTDSLKDSAKKAGEEFTTTKDLVRKEATEDAKLAKNKLTDAAEAMSTTAEETKDKVKGDAKKVKEKGKGFLSGIFKDSKHSVDEAADNTKGFLEELKKDAVTEEERIQKAAEDAAKSLQDSKEAIKADLKAEKDKVIDSAAKITDTIEHTKDQMHDKVIAEKKAIEDSAGKKISDATEKTLKAAEDSTNQAAHKVTEVKDAVQQKIKEDMKSVKGKLTDTADTAADSAETAKEKIEKEVKKGKEKSKGFFSGIFKGVKHAADEVAEDVKGFVDETKKEAEEEEERAKRAADDASRAIKNGKHKISDATSKITKDVEDTAKKTKDRVSEEIKEDSKLIKDTLTGVVDTVGDSAVSTKEKAQKEVQFAKNKANDAGEKLADSASKVVKTADDKLQKVAKDIDETQAAVEKEVKNDIKAAVEFTDDTKQKADKEMKKTKEKGKGIFSGIFKGAKHTVDEVTDDVKDFLDKTKKEAEEEADHTRRAADDAAKTVQETKSSITAEIEAKKDNVVDTISKSVDKVTDSTKKLEDQAHEKVASGKESLSNLATSTSEAIKDASTCAAEKITDGASKASKAAQDSMKEANEKIVTAKDAVKDEIKEDTKIAKEKLSGVAETVVNAAEMTTDKAEKEAKKAKDKGKSFFSGIFKGSKHAADDVVEDVKDAVDQTKKEAAELEKQAQKAIDKSAQIGVEVKDKIETSVHKGKDQVSETLSASAKTVADGVKAGEDSVKTKLGAGKEVVIEAVKITEEKITKSTDQAVKTAKDVSTELADTVKDVKKKVGSETKDINDKLKKGVESAAKTLDDAAHSTADNLKGAKEAVEKESKAAKEKGSGMFFGILKGSKQSINDVHDSAEKTAINIEGFLDDARRDASEEKARADRAARELAKSLANDIHSAQVQSTEKIATATTDISDGIKAAGDQVQKRITDAGEDFADGKKTISEEMKKTIQDGSDVVAAAKKDVEKEASKAKEKSSGFLSGIMKGAKHAVDEVSGEIKEFWQETKEEAQKDEKQARESVEGASKSIKDGKAKISADLHAVKDEASTKISSVAKDVSDSVQDAHDQVKDKVKSAKNGVVDAAKTTEQNVTRTAEATSQSLKDTGKKVGDSMKSATADIKKEIHDDVKIVEDKVTDVAHAVIDSTDAVKSKVEDKAKKHKDKSSGMFFGMLKSGEEKMKKLETDAAEGMTKHKEEIKSDKDTVKTSKKPTKAAKSPDKDIPSPVVRGESPEKAKGKSKGVLSSLVSGAKSASHKVAKEVDHATENIKDATEKFLEDTRLISHHASYDVSSPHGETNQVKVDSDVKLEAFSSLGQADREMSPKSSDSRVKSGSRIPQKISPSKEIVKEVRVVRETYTSGDERNISSTLGHLEPRASQSVTTVVTKSVRTAAATPPPSLDELGRVKDVTEEAAKRAQIFADQAVAVEKSESDFLQHSEPSYMETTTTEIDPVTNERIMRTTRVITSSNVVEGGGANSDELRDSIQKIVDQFMSEEKENH